MKDLSLLLMIVLLIFGGTSIAQAETFKGWTIEQIRAHPDFVNWDDNDHWGSPSSAAVSGDEGAEPAFHWIGSIVTRTENGQKVMLVFDENGDHLTMDGNRYFDDWIPAWVSPALDYLVDGGFLIAGCVEVNNRSRYRKGFDPDAKLKELGLP